MRHRVFSSFLLALIVCVCISSQAQTPEAALNYFKDGLKKSDQGDYDGAIEAFSRAIAISSRLDKGKHSSSRNSVSSFNGSSVPSAAEVLDENVTVIDPFTADAYNNRGFARYRKAD